MVRAPRKSIAISVKHHVEIYGEPTNKMVLVVEGLHLV